MNVAPLATQVASTANGSPLIILRRIHLEVVKLAEAGQKQVYYCAAKLIDYFKHWTDWKVSVQRTPWIYMPLHQIYEDLMGEHSLHVIRDAIALLEDLNIIERRHNPGNGQDKTWQYKFQTENLKQLLEKAGNPCQISSFNAERSEFRSESSVVNAEQQAQIPYTESDPISLEGEEKNDLELLPEVTDDIWDEVATQVQQMYQHEVYDFVGASNQDSAQAEDPWVDQSSGQSLNNEKVVDETSTSIQEPEVVDEISATPQEAEVVDDNSTSAQEHLYSNKENTSVESGVGFKAARSRPRPTKKGEARQYSWEVAPGQPIPEFLNWWAKMFYEPQGGHWAVGAYAHAYSEFYNRPDKTTNAIFPQFLAAHKRVAENCNQHQAANQQAILPSWFVLPPAPTQENVEQLAANFRQLIDDGARVALPQGIATPSCSQSISWVEATDNAIAPLPQLQHVEPACLPKAEEPTLAELVEQKRLLWKNAPITRAIIKKWAEETDGVELGEDGPVFKTDIVSSQSNI